MLPVYLAAVVLAPVAGYFLGVFTGAPYVPTERDRVERMLELAGVESGTMLADLGSGDGRILIAAARRGAQAVEDGAVAGGLPVAEVPVALRGLPGEEDGADRGRGPGRCALSATGPAKRGGAPPPVPWP